VGRAVAEYDGNDDVVPGLAHQVDGNAKTGADFADKKATNSLGLQETQPMATVTAQVSMCSANSGPAN
jgi:hypothetical protein